MTLANFGTYKINTMRKKCLHFILGAVYAERLRAQRRRLVKVLVGAMPELQFWRPYWSWLSCLGGTQNQSVG